MLDSIGLDSVKAKLLPAFFGFIFIIISVISGVYVSPAIAQD